MKEIPKKRSTPRDPHSLFGSFSAHSDRNSRRYLRRSGNLTYVSKSRLLKPRGVVAESADPNRTSDRNIDLRAFRSEPDPSQHRRFHGSLPSLIGLRNDVTHATSNRALIESENVSSVQLRQRAISEPAVTRTSAVASMLNDLRDHGGLRDTDLANMTTVLPLTVALWLSGDAIPQPKIQLLISHLRYVVERLAEFYTPDETRIWLYTRHPLLNGERAIDLLQEDRTTEVLSVIEGLDESTYI
jgi:hypothetical protein